MWQVAHPSGHSAERVAQSFRPKYFNDLNDPNHLNDLNGTKDVIHTLKIAVKKEMTARGAH
jgi:hypothetical protein